MFAQQAKGRKGAADLFGFLKVQSNCLALGPSRLNHSAGISTGDQAEDDGYSTCPRLHMKWSVLVPTSKGTHLKSNALVITVCLSEYLYMPATIFLRF